MSSKFLLMTPDGEITEEADDVKDLTTAASMLLEEGTKALVYEFIGDFISSGVIFVKAVKK